MAQAKDISGNVFGRLTAVFKIGKDYFGIAYWRCNCECGNSTDIRLGALTSGSTKSCGCLNDEVRHNRMMGNTYAETHRLSTHYLYGTWATMKQRCSNPKHAKFYLYGNRGISVCTRWNASFEAFLEDMGDRPEGYTLNRIDNNGDYTRDNCEWQSYSEQNRNRRPYKRRGDMTGLFNEV